MEKSSNLRRTNRLFIKWRSKANAFQRQLKRDNISFGSQEYIKRAKNSFPGFDPVSPLLKADSNFNVNEDKSLENEADVMGMKAAEGKKVDVAKTSIGIQKKEEGEEENQSTTSTIDTQTTDLSVQEAIVDTTEETASSTDFYFVTDSNAVIRVNEEPHKDATANSPTIPAGTKVTLISTYGTNKVKVQSAENSANTWWTSKGNIKILENAPDSDLYTAFYNDIPIHQKPGLEEGATTFYKVKANGDITGITSEVFKDFNFCKENYTAKTISFYKGTSNQLNCDPTNLLFNFTESDTIWILDCVFDILETSNSDAFFDNRFIDDVYFARKYILEDYYLTPIGK